MNGWKFTGDNQGITLDELKYEGRNELNVSLLANLKTLEGIT